LIALHAFAVDRLTDLELEFILGRQAGHIKSLHSLYTMMAEIMGASGGFGVGFAGGFTSAIISDIPGLNILTTAATKPIEWALNFWQRMAEFTADRAGLLACQDKDSVISALIKTAGLPSKYLENDCNESFIEQTREFEKMDSEWINKLFKMMRPDPSVNWPVLRAAELLKWVESGEYESVLSRESRSKVQMAREGGLIICRTCSYRLTGSEKFCPCCGSAMSITPNISAQKKTCPACSSEIKGNEKFCPGCGGGLQ
jgi:RNA polymerase subunit RPABC4/transcription elongation factor Spt4